MVARTTIQKLLEARGRERRFLSFPTSRHYLALDASLEAIMLNYEDLTEEEKEELYWKNYFKNFEPDFDALNEEEKAEELWQIERGEK